MNLMKALVNKGIVFLLSCRITLQKYTLVCNEVLSVCCNLLLNYMLWCSVGVDMMFMDLCQENDNTCFLRNQIEYNLYVIVDLTYMYKCTCL